MPEPAPESTGPPGYGTVTPWIISPDSAALIRFLEAAFDAEEIAGSRMLNQDGSIAHVEVTIGSSIVMLFDSYEGWPETLPSSVCTSATLTPSINRLSRSVRAPLRA
jgi:uncharacterized glyoxalase superfamily protein PhnB